MELNLDFFGALARMKARRAALATAGNATPLPHASPTGDARTGGPQMISPDGLALIKRFEGCARRRGDGQFEAYPDPGTGGAPWTIGWGATGRDIAPGTIWTQAECDARLERDLTRFAREVALALGDCPTSQSQFDALVSFHYNTGAITKATLTKLHNAGQYAAAQVEFGKWVHAGGRRLNGLVRRRADEARLYASN